jgi:alkylation response protein AidB-like acyl-CoA dehydrogenase
MGHYKSNVRDLAFNLFEVLDLERVLTTGAFGDLDAETARTMLDEASRLAEGPLADSYAHGDRTPPVFDPETHAVTLPEPLIASALAWQDAGWTSLGTSEEIGGVRAPRMLVHAINELGLGANPAAVMYVTGPPFADIVHALGNEQQRRWAAIAVERNWGATMVLTEPDAGSDVGAARTRATKQPDGSWHIEGVKRFITSGDSGRLFENIFHLVLARPADAEPGTKGLSLFFVPKFLFDAETGEIGERNGVYVTNLEHKMGLKGSATCELAFGTNGTPANGWLIGDVHDGIRQMFKVIENARMLVGTKAIATLSTGFLNALAYARERVQGEDLTQMADKHAPRRDDHSPPRRAPVADDAEGVRRRAASHLPVHGGPPGSR